MPASIQPKPSARVGASNIWSSALRIAAELDGTGAVTQRFIYGNKVNVPDVIVRFDGVEERLYRVITDHLGSPVCVVNLADPSNVLLSARTRYVPPKA